MAEAAEDAGKTIEEQVLVANIDTAIIVAAAGQGLDRIDEFLLPGVTAWRKLRREIEAFERRQDPLLAEHQS